MGNPIIRHKFTADPTIIEHDEREYKKYNPAFKLSHQNHCAAFRDHITQIIGSLYHPDITSGTLGRTIQSSIPTTANGRCIVYQLTEPVIYSEITQ